MFTNALKSMTRSFTTDYQLPRSRLIAHQCILAGSAILLVVFLVEVFVDLEVTTPSLLAPFLIGNLLLLILSSVKRNLNFSAAHIALQFALIQVHFFLKPEYYHSIIYWLPLLPILALLTKGVKHFKWWFLAMIIAISFNSFYGIAMVEEKYSAAFSYWELASTGALFLGSMSASCYLLYVLLGNAYARMREKNEEIERLNLELCAINDSLEDRVTERTKDIEKKNSVLEKLAFMNSHVVRSSLSRIIGAAAALEIDKTKREEMIEVIIHSSTELDNSVREMGRELA